MLSWYRAKREAARQNVRRKADDLAMFLGERAHHEALSRVTLCQARADESGSRLWRDVATELSRRAAETGGTCPTVTSCRREAIGAELLNIAEAIVAIAYGRGHATTLHNAEAAMLRLVAPYASTAPAHVAARELCGIIRDLKPTEAEIGDPAVALATISPRIARACGALERFRANVLPF